MPNDHDEEILQLIKHMIPNWPMAAGSLARWASHMWEIDIELEFDDYPFTSAEYAGAFWEGFRCTDINTEKID